MLLLSKKSFEKCRKHGDNLGVPFSEKTTFLSLAERRIRESSYAVIEIVDCFVLLNIRYSFHCNKLQQIILSNYKKVLINLTNAKNILFILISFHQLLSTSKFQISFNNYLLKQNYFLLDQINYKSIFTSFVNHFKGFA